MDNFEEMIKPFVEKVVSDKNPQVVEYVITKKIKRVTLHVDPNHYVRCRGIITPHGIFGSVAEASKAINLSINSIYVKCKAGKDGFGYMR